MSDTGNTPASSGLEARAAAVAAIQQVFSRGSFLDAALEETSAGIGESRDRAFAHAIAATVFRHKGQLEQVIDVFLERPLDKSGVQARDLLLCGAAQLLFMRTEAHAAISTSVQLADGNPKTRRYKALVNAVLRRIADNQEAILRDLPPALSSLPPWLQKKLRADLGPQVADECAQALLTQADLDLSLKDESFRQPLEAAGGTTLPTGSIRFSAPYPAIPSLPGFDEGGWWVQDAAAALPARLLGDVDALSVLDMCAAPGGKTLQLAASGAQVTALDISPVRLEVVRTNLDRTGLAAELIAIDVLDFHPGMKFDAILLDAPCSATGTIRRHPELPWLRGAQEVKHLAAVQRALLRKAAGLLKPGGTLVYAVCSLLAEEGGKQVQSFLNEHRNFQRRPVEAESLGLTADFTTRQGDLRTLPHFRLGGSTGMDGFHAARLVKVAD
ncbi:MAG: transcription antitermination factor NusB [Anderseniella sp.]|nr:transcription antitermination factor NusB [Anderseniella sp.]